MAQSEALPRLGRRGLNLWHRRTLLKGFAVSALAYSGRSFAAVQFPSRPINIVIPFAPGGQADTLTRIVAADISTRLGVAVTIDNRSGAGGALGTTYVTQAKPDGYTIAYSSSGTSVVLPLTTKISYDPDRDLTPIAQLYDVPMMIMARNDFGPSTPMEIAASAKAEPGKLTIGNSGIGALAHLIGVYFQNTLAVEALHVPYRGDAPLTQALLSGEVDLGAITVQAGGPFARSGQLKPIAVTNANRVANMPEVPTVAESGYPGFAAGTFGGLHAPAGTPTAIIDTLAKACAASVREPAIRERVAGTGCIAVSDGPEPYRQRIAVEKQLWGGVIAKLGLKPQ